MHKHSVEYQRTHQGAMVWLCVYVYSMYKCWFVDWLFNVPLTGKVHSRDVVRDREMQTYLTVSPTDSIVTPYQPV